MNRTNCETEKNCHTEQIEEQRKTANLAEPEETKKLEESGKPEKTENCGEPGDLEEPGKPVRRTADEYFLYFMMYSVIGWLYEVFLEVCVYQWGFSNRGVLFGPYCVVYGFGALVLIAALSGLQKKRICMGRVSVTPVLVFAGIVILTTAIELAASYLMEWTLGGWQWDYDRFAFNFQGRIALNPSLRFGFGGMVFLYVFQPLFTKILKRVPDRVLERIAAAAALVFGIDVLALLVRVLL